MTHEQPVVMVVEDEELLLDAITKKLVLSNIEVIPCSSGEEAIKQLKALQKLPQAIWLDYYLKDMNGLAFMEEIKKNTSWAEIPVIVVSNSASQQKAHHMLALGVKKYILKAEYRLDEILVIIRELIADNSKK